MRIWFEVRRRTARTPVVDVVVSETTGSKVVSQTVSHWRHIRIEPWGKPSPLLVAKTESTIGNGPARPWTQLIDAIPGICERRMLRDVNVEEAVTPECGRYSILNVAAQR
jgi:hypothetical protein